MLLARFFQLWNRLFERVPSVTLSVSELDKRNRELAEKKKRELGFNYAHHPKNFVTRKDGLVYARTHLVSRLVLVPSHQDRRSITNPGTGQ